MPYGPCQRDSAAAYDARMSQRDLSPEEFRELGHAYVDWIADYRARVGDLPVLPGVEPGWVRERLPAKLPEEGEPLTEVLADMDRVVVPASTHWQHPGFFAYFPANASLASLLGDMLSTGLGTQGMLWSTSPACTELEQHLLDQLADATGLPAEFTFAGGGGGVIQDSASSSSLVALLAALHRTSAGAWRTAGRDGREVLYVSAHTHSSLEKAAIAAGLGADAVRVVAGVPGGQEMSPAALAAAVREDVAAGRRPVLVCATIGTTGTGAVDPVREIAAVCAEYGVWLHVDAAWAGAAAFCPEHRALFDGAGLADSYSTDGHKWLLTAFDCNLFWTRDTATLTGALTVLPEYLRNAASESGAVVDYRDWHLPLGRRFRALKLWTVLRRFGLEGIRDHVRRHVALAAELESWAAADPRFALGVPRSLALVCLHVATGRGTDADNAATKAALERVNAGGRSYVTHTVVDGRYLLRVAVGGLETEERHVRALWDDLCAAADAAAAGTA